MAWGEGTRKRFESAGIQLSGLNCLYHIIEKAREVTVILKIFLHQIFKKSRRELKLRREAGYFLTTFEICENAMRHFWVLDE